MVVLQINLDRVAILPTEHDAPWPVDMDRKKPGSITPQTVKIKARQVHILRLRGSLQGDKPAADTRGQLRIDPGERSALPVIPQPLVTK